MKFISIFIFPVQTIQSNLRLVWLVFSCQLWFCDGFAWISWFVFLNSSDFLQWFPFSLNFLREYRLVTQFSFSFNNNFFSTSTLLSVCSMIKIKRKKIVSKNPEKCHKCIVNFVWLCCSITVVEFVQNKKKKQKQQKWNMKNGEL